MCCGCCWFCLCVLTLEGAEAQGLSWWGEGGGGVRVQLAFVEPYCHQAEMVSLPGRRLDSPAQESEGAGRRRLLCVCVCMVVGRWGLAVGPTGSGGSCACTWTPGPGSCLPPSAGSETGAEQVTQKPRGGAGGAARDGCLGTSPPPHPPSPLSCLGLPSTSGPEPRTSKCLRSQGGQGWPQAGHPATPQKGQQRKCLPGPCGQW